jgi:myo-inositol 2-dehydrogenase/D-chiro-inositol 1-dehydrogenase
MVSPQIINVGVIGAGRIGKIHAEDLANRIPGVKVVTISDPDLIAAQELAARLQVGWAIGDYHEILKDRTIDAVAICSPTALHAQHIVEAAQAGNQIFCEKPIAYDLKQIDVVLAEVEKAGVKLQIGFNRRFDASFKHAHDMIWAGKIGAPHILRITSRDPHPPTPEFAKLSGGIFFDMTIHDFDMAQFLFGEIEEVYTVGNVLVDPRIGDAGDIDTAIITLKFKNGALGTIDNSRQAVYGYDQRIEAFGSAGMVQAQNNLEDSLIYSNADQVALAKPVLFFLERYRESFITEMAQFIACVRSGEQPPVNGYDARKPVVIGLAAQRSYLEGRPVKLTEIEGGIGKDRAK